MNFPHPANEKCDPTIYRQNLRRETVRYKVPQHVHQRTRSSQPTLSPALFLPHCCNIRPAGSDSGAFGAHALHDRLVSHGSLRTWETAVDYQFWHALALLAWVLFNPSPQSRPITPIAFSIGNLLFSGSLYFLALGGPSWLGPITPLGGLSFMIGWGYWLISGPSTRLNTNEK